MFGGACLGAVGGGRIRAAADFSGCVYAAGDVVLAATVFLGCLGVFLFFKFEAYRGVVGVLEFFVPSVLRDWFRRVCGCVLASRGGKNSEPLDDVSADCGR